MFEEICFLRQGLLECTCFSPVCLIEISAALPSVNTTPNTPIVVPEAICSTAQLGEEEHGGVEEWDGERGLVGKMLA